MPPPIDAAIQVSPDGAAAIHAITDYLAGRWEADPIEMYARELLGIDPALSSSAGYRSDSVHPLFPERGTVHPDNADPLAYVARPGVHRARELRQLTSVDEVQVALSSDILLFGSPTSEGLSRVVFGYGLQAQGLYLPFENQLFRLAYRWELDERSLRGGQVRRYVRGHSGAPPRPPWQIRNVDGNARLPFYKPELIGDGPLAGFLKDDYLLVTKVPNFLTDAYVDGRFLVSFGGAHGIATRSVGVLLRSRQALVDIVRLLPPGEGRLPSSYQILLRAYPIVHDQAQGSYATGMHCVDAVALDPREAQAAWDDAQRLVRPRLAAWRSEEINGG